MSVTGEDIIITLGGIDYSNDISSYNEAGGEQQIKVIRTFGNNYEDVVVGTNDYTVTFNILSEGTQLKTLFESGSTITIVINVNSEATVTYNNMRPYQMKLNASPDGLTTGNLVYKAPAYTTGVNNRVLG